MLERIKKSTGFINNQFNFNPVAGIITGSGIGSLVGGMDVLYALDYKDIPGFPESTVEGHEGRMVFGQMSSKNIVLLQGRYHYYEGLTMEQVTFPVRILKQLGIRYLILTNSSGGLNPDFVPGDLMIHTDHINLMPNPLIGIHHAELGERFPDMSQPYDDFLNRSLIQLADNEGITIKKGCYVGVTGPTYETRAEYNYYRLIGGDTVGMSTIPEVIVANQMGIRCVAISIITNSAKEKKSTGHKQVLAIAEKAEPYFNKLISGLLNMLD
ncbi:MAG: purine-nucleoside phosphorylase [Bacteroidales bacterium]|nr:purine-nucleoside phosphorylase [Bacteroidales bacterium]